MHQPFMAFDRLLSLSRKFFYTSITQLLRIIKLNISTVTLVLLQERWRTYLSI